jgi:hypothetical protein
VLGDVRRERPVTRDVPMVPTTASVLPHQFELRCCSKRRNELVFSVRVRGRVRVRITKMLFETW